jgi:hypothetical protein
VAGRIRSIEKSNDLIGNRTCDLPTCSIVPQQTTLPRTHNVFRYKIKFNSTDKLKTSNTNIYPETRFACRHTDGRTDVHDEIKGCKPQTVALHVRPSHALTSDEMGLRCCCENRMLPSTDSTSHSLIHSYD